MSERRLPVTIGGKELGKEGLKYLPLIAVGWRLSPCVNQVGRWTSLLRCWRCGSAPSGSSPGRKQVMDRQRIRTSECKPKTRRQREARPPAKAGNVSILGSWSKCPFPSWEGRPVTVYRPALMTIAAAPRVRVRPPPPKVVREASPRLSMDVTPPPSIGRNSFSWLRDSAECPWGKGGRLRKGWHVPSRGPSGQKSAAGGDMESGAAGESSLRLSA